jgi:nitrous oxidase accessory protein NosD
MGVCHEEVDRGGIVGLILSVVASTAQADRPDRVCDAEISPGESVQGLVDSLDPGEVGCLEEGTYTEDVTFDTGDGGTPGDFVTLRSEPDERATIKGRIVITDAADFVVIQGLNLDGFDPISEQSSVTINGDNVILSQNDIYNGNSRICVDVGATGLGRALNTTIKRNKIHDCGDLVRDEHDHGVFLEQSSGADVTDNWIYDNADRGVQLYPNAQDAEIRHNVIDGNGEDVSFGGGNEGEGDQASSNNTVSNNLLTVAVKRWLVEENWQVLTGTGNVASDNCLWPDNPSDPFFNQNGGISLNPVGFVATNNTALSSDPYVSRANKDFSLRSGVCAGKGPRSPVGPQRGDHRLHGKKGAHGSKGKRKRHATKRKKG